MLTTMENLTEPILDDTLLEGIEETTLTPALLDKLQYMLKRKEVLKNYHFPDKPTPQGLYRIWVKDGTMWILKMEVFISIVNRSL